MGVVRLIDRQVAALPDFKIGDTRRCEVFLVCLGLREHYR